MIGSEQLTTGHGALPGVSIAFKTGTAEHGADPKNTPPRTPGISRSPRPITRSSPSIVEDGGHQGDAATGGFRGRPHRP